MSIQLIIFLLGSAGLVILSGGSFLSPQSHGLPRFIAFEAILGLAIWNAPAWFSQPFSFVQILSWLLLAISALLALAGINALRHYGAPDKSLEGDGRQGFEKTTRLVKVGPYRSIRHPIYAALLYLVAGMLLKQIDLIAILLAFIAFLAIFLTAIYEERENLETFGDEYVEYMLSTKRFIPGVF